MNKSGYTLIELLLVISVIAVMAAVSIMTYRNHIENNRINLASLNMQSVMQAAISFNGDSSAWPKPNDDLSTCVSQQPNADNEHPFVANYLPNQSAKTTFGNYYCWGNFTANPNLFWLAMPTPYGDVQLAKRIIGLLPNAALTQTPSQLPITPCVAGEACFIRVEISNSAAATPTTNGIVGAGICPIQSGTVAGSAPNMRCTFNSLSADKATVNLSIDYTCPVNESGQVILIPSLMNAGIVGTHSPSAVWQVIPSVHCASQTGVANTHCAVSVLAKGYGRLGFFAAQGQLQLSYLTFCKANSLINNNNNNRGIVQ